MARVMNFNAGPAALPLPALERAREELLDFAGSGMSVMEHSHRGKEYEAVHNEAISLLRELLSIPADYDVLFLQGGASQQFAQVPMNLLQKGQTGAYAVTGAWGEKAFAEAKNVGAMLGSQAVVSVTSGKGDGKEKSYTHVPPGALGGEGAAYLHFTTNETIHGVQFAIEPGAQFPTASAPLIADMSSDFLWRRIDVSRFSVIYAGAQKNIGPSGVLVLVAKKDVVAAGRKDIPKIFQYRVAAENNSLYNTPPTFGIYLMRNVLDWAKQRGGLDAIEQENRAKARAVYAAIDGSAGYYRGPVEKGSRSAMNVVFRLGSEALEEKFVSAAKKAGMVGLKGHRSVGGIRASLYNAVPLAWAESLAAFMTEFARQNG
jgi:phosphoserine aminotransferase